MMIGQLAYGYRITHIVQHNENPAVYFVMGQDAFDLKRPKFATWRVEDDHGHGVRRTDFHPFTAWNQTAGQRKNAAVRDLLTRSGLGLALVS